MASRDLKDLHPKVRTLCEAFLAKAKAQGIDVLVTCTYRSNAEQTTLYNQGRTTPGHIVTNAKAGTSMHNTVDAKGNPASQAFDVVPMVAGKCVWDDSAPQWAKLGQIGTEVGLEWAGHWVSFKEFPHFQLSHI